MRAAIIKNDTVINVIIVDDLNFPVDGELISAEPVDGLPVAEIGWIRQQDGTFAEPQ